MWRANNSEKEHTMRNTMLATTLGLLLFVQPIWGGEQPVKESAAFPIAPPAGELQPQYFPRAAWNPSAKTWLVVWEDGLPTGDGTSGDGQGQNILAVRVSVEGSILDAKPIEVCRANGLQLRAKVASDGKDFLVVWHDLRNGKDWDIYSTRISSEGKVVDPASVAIASGEHNQCFPEVVFGGGSYYVAWLDMRHFPEYRVYGTRLTSAGKLLDGQGVELLRMMTDKEMELWRTASFSPGKKGFGWHRFDQVGANGMKQPGPPQLATNGTVHCLMSTVHAAESKGADWFALVIDGKSGRPMESPQAVQSLETFGGTRLSQSPPSLRAAPAGENGFLAASFMYTGGFGSFGDGVWLCGNISASRPKSISLQPTFLDSHQVVPEGYRTFGNRQLALDVAWDGKCSLFVCERHTQKPTPCNVDILGLFVDAEGKRIADFKSGRSVEMDQVKTNGPSLVHADGVAIAPIAIAAGANYQAAPAASAGPEGTFLVVWQEEPLDQDSRIMARLLTIDPNGGAVKPGKQ
jgi:hypothetical protein